MKVKYNSFDQNPSKTLCRKLKVPYLEIGLNDSTKEYITTKVKSKIVASWIMKTPFFNALYNMLPGLGYMISLGHLIDQLKSDPELIIVCDTPSTGHVTTLFESPQNFKKIFKKGLIADDIHLMEKYIYNKNFLKIVISTLPGLMTIHEAMDLKRFLQGYKLKNIDLVMNNSFLTIDDLKMDKLPNFLKNKLKIEKNVLKKYNNQIITTLPHIISHQKLEVIEGLVPHIKNII